MKRKKFMPKNPSQMNESWKVKNHNVSFCEESYPQKNSAFLKFPKDETRLKNLWIKKISPLLDILKMSSSRLNGNGKICARHFQGKDFINFKKNSFAHNACPNINVSELGKRYLEERTLNGAHANKSQSFQKNESVFNCQDKDTFQCGRCKTQFQLLSEFIDHKRSLCKSGGVIEKSDFDNSSHSLENTFLVSFENKLPNLNSTKVNNKPEEDVLKVVNEKPETDNEILSFVMHKNELVLGNAIPSNVPQQIIISPKISAGNRSVLLNDTENNESFANMILIMEGTNSNGKIVFTCPIQNDQASNALTLSQEVPDQEGITHVILTESESKSLENQILDNSDNVLKINNSFDALNLQNHAQNINRLFEEQLQTENKCDISVKLGELDGKELIKNKTQLPCSYCGKVFEKPFNLQQHERVHTGERPFQCIICGRAFSQKSNVRKHMMRHKVWPQAKRTLKLQADMNQQSISQEFLDQMNYSCQYCSLSFKSYSLYKKHLTIHSNFKVYRCIQKGCDETFSDLDEFLSHSKIHPSAEFQCHICLRSFTSLDELGAHQYEHDMTGRDKKEIEVKLKCEVCHSQFKTVEALKNHLAVDTHNYECPHCKNVFSSERFLRRHLATHLDPSQSKFKCSNCKKTFRTQKYLNNHVFVHSKKKPFDCELCKKQFASKYRLKRHLAIHLNDYFECPFKAYLGCYKTFYRKDKLKDHVTTHSNIRIRSCQFCSKTFSSPSKLNQHSKKEHKFGREKQVLKCANCSQTFRKQKQMLQHHCTVGERKFRSNGRNRNSEKASHSETVSNIEIIMVPYVSASDEIDGKSVEDVA